MMSGCLPVCYHQPLGHPEVLDDYWYNFPKQTALQETTEPTVPETTVPETTIPETTAPSTEEVVFALESEPLFVTEPEHVPQRAEEPQTKEGLSRWFWVIVAAAGASDSDSGDPYDHPQHPPLRRLILVSGPSLAAKQTPLRTYCKPFRNVYPDYPAQFNFLLTFTGKITYFVIFPVVFLCVTEKIKKGL